MPNEVKLLPCDVQALMDFAMRAGAPTVDHARRVVMSEGRKLLERVTRPTTVVTDEVVERVKLAICVELFERQGLGHDVPQGINDGSVRIGGCVSLDGLARAAIASMPTVVTGEQPQWQPIESAPKDGTAIIGGYFNQPWAESHREGDITRCWFQPEFDAFISSCREMQMHGKWQFEDGATRKLHSPVIEDVTHWQPLPEPPAQPGDA